MTELTVEDYKVVLAEAEKQIPRQKELMCSTSPEYTLITMEFIRDLLKHLIKALEKNEKV